MSNYGEQFDNDSDQMQSTPSTNMHWLAFNDPRVENAMRSGLFQTIQGWIQETTGLNLQHVVMGICLFTSTGMYTSKILKWLESHGTNTVSINPDDVLAQDLEVWVAQQPSNQFFDWLPMPSFSNLEWKEVQNRSSSQSDGNSWGDYSTSNEKEEDKHAGYDNFELVASTGRSFFFYQGIPFILEKTDKYHKIKLRCLWGSAAPIHALLKHVQRISQNRDKHLRINFVWGHKKTEVIQGKKRHLSSIDMDPTVKQDILTDLQDFFDPETENWYWENGTPYRKGHMYYGNPGSGKSSLCIAIATEFNLPVYYFNLMDMDDSILHSKFQELPKRCLLLFEEIDTAGIMRQDFSDTNEEDTSDAEDNAEEEKPAKKKNGKGDEGDKKKAKAKAKKSQPRRSKVSLGALLNEIDGPGAKEGRLLIFTTNSPLSLDSALVRPGRIDKRVYLGHTTKMVAALTFQRIYGTDPRLRGKFKKQELVRMGNEFGIMVPENTFTTCEIQQFCISHRGKPDKAIKEFPKWIQEKLSGAHGFLYDIKHNPSGVNAETRRSQEGWQDYLMKLSENGAQSTPASHTESWVTAHTHLVMDRNMTSEVGGQSGRPARRLASASLLETSALA